MNATTGRATQNMSAAMAHAHGNGRLCCTTTPQSSHISRRQLIYIKEKDTGFLLNRKAKESDKNWVTKLRSKSR
jgi:hypothetical protein